MKRIWLDCDPGHDDMLAIIMASLSEDCTLVGISTSAGNSGIENTTTNTLNILAEIGHQGKVDVVRGAECPIINELLSCPEIHGESGLQGTELKQSDQKPISSNPFSFIHNKLQEEPNPIEFVVTGPMTNLAILLKAFPDIRKKISRITIMGGAIGLGNWGAAGEFNIVVDPEAAAIVFNAGIPLVMVPLQVTHTVLITEDIFQKLAKMEGQFCQKLIPLFRLFQKKYKENQNFEFPAAHDPCTIFYLRFPEFFSARNAVVQIQLEGKSRGRTNCNFFSQKKPNALVCEKIDSDKFWEEMLGCIAKIK